MKKSQAKQEKKGEVQSLEERREFIRQWRIEITEEIAEGMPKWNVEPEQPFVISSMGKFMAFPLAASTEDTLDLLAQY